MKWKILAILNLILMLTIINGLTYSHWQDTTYIQGTIKMGRVNLVIDSEKVLVPRGEGYDENHSRNILQNFRQTHTRGNM